MKKLILVIILALLLIIFLLSRKFCLSPKSYAGPHGKPFEIGTWTYGPGIKPEQRMKVCCPLGSQCF